MPVQPITMVFQLNIPIKLETNLKPNEPNHRTKFDLSSTKLKKWDRQLYALNSTQFAYVCRKKLHLNTESILYFLFFKFFVFFCDSAFLGFVCGADDWALVGFCHCLPNVRFKWNGIRWISIYFVRERSAIGKHMIWYENGLLRRYEYAFRIHLPCN